MTSNNEIGFSIGGVVQPAAIVMTDEVRLEVIRAGGNPAEYNRMRWPAGASSYASGRFLVHGSLLDEWAGDTGPHEFVFGEVSFDRVWVRNPIPILISEGSGPVFSVEVVDERHGWSDIYGLLAAVNLTLDDREQLYDATEDTDEVPWTVRRLLEEWVIGGLGVPVSDLEVPPDPDPQPDPLAFEPRDVTVEGIPLPILIDRMLAMTGHVLIAETAPQPTESRYRVVPIASGEASVGAFLSLYTDDLIGGGVYSLTADYVPPSGGAGSVAHGAPSWSIRDVPIAVAVHFPKAVAGGIQQSAGDEDDTDTSNLNYPLQRYWAISQSPPPLPGVVADDDETVVFDPTWAIVPTSSPDVPDNEADLLERAQRVSENYYARFRSGACNLLMRRALPVTQWPGGQEIIWSKTMQGITTRIVGSYHHPLFGYRLDMPLAPTSVEFTHRGKTLQRSDGTTLFDILPDTVRLHYGEITAVQGAENATYDAESYDSPSTVFVSGMAPRHRHIDVPSISALPAAVGDNCLLGIRPEVGDPGYVVDLYCWEQPKTIDCDVVQSPASQQLDRFLGMTIMGF